MSSKLNQIKKHNDGMYNNLVKNNVIFNRDTPPEDPDEAISFFQDEQQKLKNALIEFRKSQPKSAPKPKKAKNPPQQKKLEEKIPERKPSFPTIANMEELKRAFFDDDFDTFNKLVRLEPYLFYRANYKFSDETDGRPDYVAKNFVKGFVNNLDEHRKYFFSCFRCYNIEKSEDKKYMYQSLWIVNTNANLDEVTDNYTEDFKFTKVETTDLDSFLNEFQKSEEVDLVTEIYLH